MILDLIASFVLQIVCTIGLIVIFGILIAVCNKCFYANLGRYGRVACVATGFIGTPLHECSHALFCVLFGHKITSIKLFQISSDDGTLGYVQHSYNPKNIYHKIGCFFIGVAPIVVISLVLYGMAWLLLPEFASAIDENIQIDNIISDFTSIFNGIANTLTSFFSLVTEWQWWVFVLIGSLFALHMNLSKADIKNSISGLIVLIIIVLLADIIIALISVSILDSVTAFVLKMSSYLLCVFLLAIIISFMLVVVSFGFAKMKKSK